MNSLLDLLYLIFIQSNLILQTSFISFQLLNSLPIFHTLILTIFFTSSLHFIHTLLAFHIHLLFPDLHLLVFLFYLYPLFIYFLFLLFLLFQFLLQLHYILFIFFVFFPLLFNDPIQYSYFVLMIINIHILILLLLLLLLLLWLDIRYNLFLIIYYLPHPSQFIILNRYLDILLTNLLLTINISTLIIHNLLFQLHNLPLLFLHNLNNPLTLPLLSLHLQPSLLNHPISLLNQPILLLLFFFSFNLLFPFFLNLLLPLFLPLQPILILLPFLIYEHLLILSFQLPNINPHLFYLSVKSVPFSLSIINLFFILIYIHFPLLFFLLILDLQLFLILLFMLNSFLFNNWLLLLPLLLLLLISTFIIFNPPFHNLLNHHPSLFLFLPYLFDLLGPLNLHLIYLSPILLSPSFFLLLILFLLPFDPSIYLD